jgi:hypothetical protein
MGALIAMAVVVLAAGAWLGRLIARKRVEAWSIGVRQVVQAIGAAARAEQIEILRAAEIAAREDALTTGAAFEARCRGRESELAAAGGQLHRREAALAVERVELDARREQLGPPRQRVEAR